MSCLLYCYKPPAWAGYMCYISNYIGQADLNFNTRNKPYKYKRNGYYALFENHTKNYFRRMQTLNSVTRTYISRAFQCFTF